MAGISPARVARCRCGRVFDPGTELLALPLVTDPLPRGGELLRAPISNCGVIANVRAVDALALNQILAGPSVGEPAGGDGGVRADILGLDVDRSARVGPRAAA